MAVTLSGHPYPPPQGIGTFRVPGTTRSITVARAFAPLLLDLLRRWQVHPDLGGRRLNLNPGPLDSLTARPARAGGGALSDHAGYAIDVRYDVLKADHAEHMTRAENEAVRALLAAYSGVIAWGGPTASASRANPGRSVGRYSRLIDEMHFYIAPDITVAKAQKVQKSLGIRPDGTRPGVPAVPAAPVAKPAALPVVRVSAIQDAAKVDGSARNARYVKKALAQLGYPAGDVDSDGCGLGFRKGWAAYQSGTHGIPTKSGLQGLAQRTRLFALKP